MGLVVEVSHCLLLCLSLVLFVSSSLPSSVLFYRSFYGYSTWGYWGAVPASEDEWVVWADVREVERLVVAGCGDLT